jgi:hypothetical protein
MKRRDEESFIPPISKTRQPCMSWKLKTLKVEVVVGNRDNVK